MNNLNLIGYWVYLSRAYEIALLGNFTIQIVFDKEYTQGFDDYQKIKDFYSKVDFIKDGDLVVEITEPNYDQDLSQYETITDIHLRVENAKKNIKPNNKLNDASKLLLKTATQRLNLSLDSREKVIEIATIIAQLEGKDSIRIEHIAEAIQYVVLKDNSGICNAENKSIKFGKGIEITLYELNNEDINNAIEYLNEIKQNKAI